VAGAQKLTKKERAALKKKMRKANRERRDSDDEGAFEADLDDPRFAVRLLLYLHVLHTCQCPGQVC
jgi:hypothetical protein